jgi:hypothetical protein
MIARRQPPRLALIYLHVSECVLAVARLAVARGLAPPRLLHHALKASNRLCRAAMKAWRGSVEEKAPAAPVKLRQRSLRG